MDMDNRKRLIREVLDEDININQKVVGMNRSRVMGTHDEVAPYVQIDQEDIEKMRQGASALRLILEKKTTLAEQIQFVMNGRENINAQLMDLAHAEELLAAYNSVVTIYLNPRNTQETKSYISRILTAFEGQVQALVNHTAAIIANMRRMNRPHLASMLYAPSLFHAKLGAT